MVETQKPTEYLDREIETFSRSIQSTKGRRTMTRKVRPAKYKNHVINGISIFFNLRHLATANFIDVTENS